jgi:Tfp pilus assembly protein PilF
VKEADKSVALLRQAVTLAPDSRDVRLQLAQSLYDKGEFREAEKHFKVLLQKAPSR